MVAVLQCLLELCSSATCYASVVFLGMSINKAFRSWADRSSSATLSLKQGLEENSSSTHKAAFSDQPGEAKE